MKSTTLSSRWNVKIESLTLNTDCGAPYLEGYSRKGAALFGLKRLDEAIDAYKKGLELDPENAQLKDGLADVERAMTAGAQGMATGTLC